MEGSIKGRAKQFSPGDPMLAEDLAQEGREAVIKHLRQTPDCPDSHLVVQAKSAIYHYRKRGSSVDGKLDTCFRAARRICSRFTVRRSVTLITPLRSYTSSNLGRNLYL